MAESNDLDSLNIDLRYGVQPSGPVMFRAPQRTAQPAPAAAPVAPQPQKTQAIARITRQHQPRLSQNLSSLGAVAPYVPPPTPHSQAIIIHGTISKGSTTARHVQQYLAPEKGRPGRDTPFFGPHGTVPDATGFVTRATPDPHQFRFVVSLQGHPPFFPMRPFVELLLAQMEKDLKRPLDWLAQVQTDTKNLHAHVVVRGKDRTETDLYIRNAYLREGLRTRAQTILTDFLGPTRHPDRGQEQTPHQEAPVHRTRVRVPEQAEAPHAPRDQGAPRPTVETLRAQMETCDQEFMLAKEGGDEARAAVLGRAMWRIQRALDALGGGASPTSEQPPQDPPARQRKGMER